MWSYRVLFSLQEMLWQLANGLDQEKAKEMIFLRSPFLEITSLCGDAGAVQSMDAAEDKKPQDK